MNILPLNLAGSSFYNRKIINNKTPKASFENFVNQENNSYKKISSELLREYYSGNINFSGSKAKHGISSLEPDFNLLNCDYSNIDEFSELFSNKLNSQLMIISKKDIENLVLRLKKQTKASDELVKKVLYELTLLSNYSTVDYLEKLINKYQAANFKLPFNINGKTSDFSTNSSLHYLISEKGIINPSFNNDNILFVLDNTLLEELEESAADFSKKDFCEIFLNALKKDKLTLLNIKGWDVKCSDGSYKSANFLFGTSDLEELASDVIKRVQQGENLDKILYCDFEERLNKVFENLLYKYEINVYKESPDVKENITIDDIYQNIKMPSISKERVKLLFESFYDLYGDILTQYSKEQIFSCIAKYLDEQSLVFSVDSLAYHLQTIQEKIDEKLQKDNILSSPLYCVGDIDKSFIYVTNLFARINGVSQSDIFEFNQENIGKLEKERPVVFLDDISASAQTSKYLCSEIQRDRSIKKFPLYLANIVMCKIAKELLTSGMDSYTPPDAVLFPLEVNDFTAINAPRTKYLNILQFAEAAKITKLKTDMEEVLKKCVKDDYKLLNCDDVSFIQEIFNNGFAGSCLSVAFPYMIPDNDCDFSAVLFDNLLIKSKTATNKALENEMCYNEGMGSHVIEKLQEALLGT